MQTVLFTKLFRGRSLAEIAYAASELGFDGIDLLIRPGHQAEPDDPAPIHERGATPAASRARRADGDDRSDRSLRMSGRSGSWRRAPKPGSA